MLINAILYGICAILWFYNGLRDGDASDFVLAAVWLTGAVIWLVRYFRKKNAEEEN